MGYTDRGRGRSIQNWNLTKYSLLSAQDAMVASATQTQAAGTPIKAMYNGFGTVASAGNAATLPPAKAGLQITVFNNGANAMNVFPAGATQGGVSGGDRINTLAQNAAFSVINQSAGVTGIAVLFTCLTDGTWWTK
jgi:hypothetical protein